MAYIFRDAAGTLMVNYLLRDRQSAGPIILPFATTEGANKAETALNASTRCSLSLGECSGPQVNLGMAAIH